MELRIDKHNSTPADEQIQEQINMAVSFGTLRKGDTLPSIRAVEKQTGVNRGLVYKAYCRLHRAGVIEAGPGKRAVIAAHTVSSNLLNAKCNKLSEAVLAKVQRMGISSISFARYLRQQAEESEREAPMMAFVSPIPGLAVYWAAEISRIWRINVTGLSLRKFSDALRSGSRPRCVLSFHFDYDIVRLLVGKKRFHVIPISLQLAKGERHFLTKIKRNSKVLVIVPDEYRSMERVFAKQLRLGIKAVNVTVSSLSRRDALKITSRGSRYDYIVEFAGNGQMRPLPFRRHSRATLFRGEIEAESLESARIKAGVIA